MRKTKSSTAQRKAAASGRQRLRIIGGQWRGRRFEFPEAEGLRPTGDRIRETLFNWLQVQVPGATVLDLYAGSGALGLEAASRGAARVILNDASAKVTRHLSDISRTLDAQDRIEVCTGSALALLNNDAIRADVVFVDPPFAAGLFDETLQLLGQGACLAEGARIYLECPKGMALPAAFGTWFEVLREKSTGQVDYRLLSRR
ncbi:16S rRNA (guanine(966)-N(2))-methyltransferase RsmD [Granulosicoccaceae sp. 1_MG-2023]|nr:16S rRNA (guanine(966)-N(2))-methyltransferase RsmD [Granulosicoccaceae sp. 1_MG-2023]